MPDASHEPSKNVDLRKTYDAIVIGSGAAGGMAAHVLTSHGLKVLLLRSRKKAAHRERIEVDGMALQPSTPWRSASR